MKTQLNGINYTEQLLTDEELAVVKAMRLGAKIDVNLHGLKELSEVDEIMDLFAEFDKRGRCSIDERWTGKGARYISFVKRMNNINLACFLDIKKD